MYYKIIKNRNLLKKKNIVILVACFLFFESIATVMFVFPLSQVFVEIKNEGNVEFGLLIISTAAFLYFIGLLVVFILAFMGEVRIRYDENCIEIERYICSFRLSLKKIYLRENDNIVLKIVPGSLYAVSRWNHFFSLETYVYRIEINSVKVESVIYSENYDVILSIYNEVISRYPILNQYIDVSGKEKLIMQNKIERLRLIKKIYLMISLSSFMFSVLFFLPILVFCFMLQKEWVNGKLVIENMAALLDGGPPVIVYVLFCCSLTICVFSLIKLYKLKSMLAP